MAEVLTEFAEEVQDGAGELYNARAVGGPDDSGLWQGWLEFTNVSSGDVVRSARETTQPNRTDTVYWATGLTGVYLEGALQRALRPAPRAAVRPGTRTVASQPAKAPAPERTEPPVAESILNPFSVYRKGEALLRRQLAAFSVWHLVNIIRDHELSDRSARELNAMSTQDLIALIVAGVRARTEPVAR
jgi:hypothetical protein